MKHTDAAMKELMARWTWMSQNAVEPVSWKSINHGTSACSWCPTLNQALVAGGTHAAATLETPDASLETFCIRLLCQPLPSASLDSSTRWASESASGESLTERQEGREQWNTRIKLLKMFAIKSYLCFICWSLLTHHWSNTICIFHP